MQKKSKKESENTEHLFSDIKSSFMDYDPAHFIENHLVLEGKPYRISGNGWKFTADIYRYIALQATKPTGKPVVICKGRQVGGTVGTAATELYFTNSGMFSNPPIRVAHLFPSINQMKRFVQGKLDDLIRNSKDDFINDNKLGGAGAVDNLTMKQFKSGTLWVESIGADGDRLRGITLDVAFFDECFPYNTYIYTSSGNLKIGKLVEMFQKDKTLPLVKTFNENTGTFEFKKIVNVWEREERSLISMKIGHRVIKCTPNHKFLTSDGWQKAEDITSGTLIKSYVSDSASDFMKVVYVKDEGKKDIVYDIEVEDNHNFIVTSSLKDKFKEGIVAHNCQDMPKLAINNTVPVLTQSKYGPAGTGVQVYFGTPKQRDSYFYNLWNMSDKRYYHLGCINCAETFPFYITGTEDWQKIWINGHIIKCPICGREQSKIDAIERGSWISTIDDPESAKYVGFHLNQLYVPALSREYINNQMPQNNPTKSLRSYSNEILGEFYSGSGLPLTTNDIYDNCVDLDREFAKSINPADKNVYMGLDWGQKVDEKKDSDGQSFSCAVILSATVDGKLLIEHAHKLRDTSFNYKKETVLEMYKRFGVKQAVSDWFFGNDVVSDVQSVYGERMIGTMASGSLRNPIQYNRDSLMIMFNKNLIIEEVFDKIKNGTIRFPWKSYEHIEWLIEHCTSMDMILKTQGGQQYKHYEKGGTPNDGLMALLHAYIAYKFDMTNKFELKNYGNNKGSGMPKPTLAFAPKIRGK
jgi:hypothetical protein